jgi:hypothetical protein
MNELSISGKISVIRKKIQELNTQLLLLEELKKREDQQALCDSESSLFMCERCGCWKIKRIIGNEIF